MAGEAGVDEAKFFLSTVGDESMSLRLCLRSRQAKAWLSQEDLAAGDTGETGVRGTEDDSSEPVGLVDTERRVLLGCFSWVGTLGGVLDGS